jgi:hypothetical protein
MHNNDLTLRRHSIIRLRTPARSHLRHRRFSRVIRPQRTNARFSQHRHAVAINFQASLQHSLGPQPTSVVGQGLDDLVACTHSRDVRVRGVEGYSLRDICVRVVWAAGFALCALRCA